MSEFEVYRLQKQVSRWAHEILRQEAALDPPAAIVKGSIRPFLFGAITTASILAVAYPLGNWIAHLL